MFHDSRIHKRGNLCSLRHLQFDGDCSLARYVYSILNILVRSATRTFTRILAHASLRTTGSYVSMYTSYVRNVGPIINEYANQANRKGGAYN